MNANSTRTKRLMLIFSTFILACTFCVFGCGDDDNSPPTYGDNGSDKEKESTKDGESTDEASSPSNIAKYTGLDLLLVVDNSGSMAEEHSVLATGLFTLVNKLMNPVPLPDNPVLGTPAIEALRVGVVNTDMGLQWESDSWPLDEDIPGCDGAGDDGEYQPIDVRAVPVLQGQIPCAEDGNQCPDGFECEGSFCTIAEDADAKMVTCPDMASWDDWVEGSRSSASVFAHKAACMADQGTSGCNVEQQLKAATRGLTQIGNFVASDHKLAVLIVSDEEDCSVNSRSLFDTEEWKSGAEEMLNVACNYPPENEEYLTPTEEYREQLLSLKGDDEDAVVFGAIVGVPNGADSPCQGDGATLEANGCLDDEDMELALGQFEAGDTGSTYIHFIPACTRQGEEGEITAARPGRRFVEVAQTFGTNGLVYSICNDDWSEAMETFADMAMAKVETVRVEYVDDEE